MDSQYLIQLTSVKHFRGTDTILHISFIKRVQLFAGDDKTRLDGAQGWGLVCLHSAASILDSCSYRFVTRYSTRPVSFTLGGGEMSPSGVTARDTGCSGCVQRSRRLLEEMVYNRPRSFPYTSFPIPDCPCSYSPLCNETGKECSALMAVTSSVLCVCCLSACSSLCALLAVGLRPARTLRDITISCQNNASRFMCHPV